jgi:hypothetical protein
MRIGNLEFPRVDLHATELLLKILGPFKTWTSDDNHSSLVEHLGVRRPDQVGRDMVDASVVHIFNASDDSRPIATWNFGLVSALEL